MNLIFGWAVFSLYLVISVACARAAYRAEYKKVSKDPTLKLIYGEAPGRRVHEVARSEAYQWLAFWPFFFIWEGLERLITAPPKISKIDELEAEIDALAAEQDPFRTVGGHDLPWIDDAVKQAEKIIFINGDGTVWTGRQEKDHG